MGALGWSARWVGGSGELVGLKVGGPGGFVDPVDSWLGWGGGCGGPVGPVNWWVRGSDGSVG